MAAQPQTTKVLLFPEEIESVSGSFFIMSVTVIINYNKLIILYAATQLKQIYL